MRKYTYENEEFLYAKGLFFRSLSSYEDATPIERKQMIEGIKEKLNNRVEADIDDCYTIASRWFLRLESWLNTNLKKI